ncbi:transporter substrate-binding domain-containing protein [Maridesulfovibrio sp.]|uniref:substrate-binding periplasmic protein n=1 Tax=Maridesulfovibrio sp. TaxID=2795000 RepID=UPI002A18BF13|nr:transporter substrate-binding domain-containing protein [Maridesulfovibrio sp.]
MKNTLYLIFTYSTIIFSILALSNKTIYADQITIGYIELPPYYYTNDQQKPDGILLYLTKKIMRRAGCNCEYISMPSKRILHTLKKGGPFASIGWFKTPEREEYAKFSLPIYENKPILVLLRKEDREQFSKYNTLEELLKQSKYKTGLIAGHSMGGYIDYLLTKHPQAFHALSGTTQQLVRMLYDKRIDFCLLAPVEIAKIIKQSPYKENDFYFMSMADIIKGNTRHLIFSKDVSNDTISKINAAITEIKYETELSRYAD